MPLLPVLKRTREEFEPRGVEAFAYLDDISIGMMEITPDTVEVVPFLQRELSNIGVAINPSKTIALPPTGHIPTPEQITLLEGIGVSIAERGGVKVVGVPVGTDEYARQRPDISGGGKHLWSDGRIVPSAQRRVKGETVTNHLCDHLGREFAQSSLI